MSGEVAAGFVVGCLIGCVLGYIVRALQEIKEEVDEVLDIERHKNEQGSLSLSWLTFNHVAILITVALTAFAAFSAQRASNTSEEVVTCTTQYNINQGEALHSRDAAVKDGTASEIKLWTRYAKLYAIAEKDPKRIPEVQKALNKAINSHRLALIDTQVTRSQHPYPDPDVLKDCKETTS